ncbi:hypothetical protein [Actinomadura litoris]|uniref:hypothetical protein n=1 Tax=Actinomadura litoris TaxID=2678616 RepID=UPI001FA78498|nr:hypothetical protein [Actinomadura litoris]
MSESAELNRASRIRVALSEAAAQLADRAAVLVRTGSDGLPGDLTDEARRLLAQAEQVLELAVLCDRRRGAPWAAIGEALGDVSKQTAHERYAEADRRLDEALIEHWLTGESPAADLPPGADASVRTLVRLDEWAATRNRVGTVPDEDPERQVTSGLAPMTTAEHGALLTAAEALIGTITDTVRRHALEEGHANRAVQWHERRLADELAAPGSTGTPVEELREHLTKARTRLTDL